MRVYIVYRHYWPDTAAYSRLLRSIAERLAADGHEVEVFTSQPSYNDVRLETQPLREDLGGVRIVRMALLWERKAFLLSRLLNNGLFLGAAVIYGLLRRRPDLVMTASMPPAMAGTAARLLSRCRSSLFLYHCQDLHPEALRTIGRLSDGLLYRLMMACEKATHRSADIVVIPSEDMAAAVRERGLTGDNLHVINSFVLESYQREAELPPLLRRRPDEVFRVLFAGNHGLYQGLEQVIDAAQQLRDRPGIQFQFVGEGLVKAQLAEGAGDLLGRTVFFHPLVSVEVARRVMEEADVGLVSLAAGLYRLAYPSKTMTLLAAGLPVLAVIEPESELSRLVARERIGWTCPPGDASALAHTVLQAYAERGQRRAMDERCRRVAAELFGIMPSLERWSRLFRDLEGRAAGPTTAGAPAARRSRA